MSNKKRRDEQKAERERANQAEKAASRRTLVIGGAAVAAVVLGILGIALVASSESDPASAPAPDAAAALPAGVLGADSAYPYAIPYGSAPDSAPVFELWGDFQCPACAALEEANGAGIARAAEAGDVQLLWRPATFLDDRLPGNASARATAAWGCAVDEGLTREYHDVVYANQPEVEGDGWTDDQLVAFATEAGLGEDRLPAFESCVREGTYLAWAANSNQEFGKASLPGTPAGLLNGILVPNQDLAAPDTFAARVQASEQASSE